MKKLTKGIAAAAALALVVSTGTSAHAATPKVLNLQLIAKGFTAQFWQAVKAGAVNEGKVVGAKVNFVGPPAETDIDQQLQMLDTAIALKPDGIGYAALGTTQSLSHLAVAHKNHIPVVEFDTRAGSATAVLGASSPIALGFAATNSLGAGAAAADQMGKLLNGTGEVIVLGHSQTNQTGIDRANGFITEIKAKFPNITLDPTVYAEGGDQNLAQTQTQAILTAHPKIAGIFATNEGCAEGAGTALVNNKVAPGAIKLIGFDSGKLQIDHINSGIQTGAITQNPVGIGKLVVDSLVNYIRNKKLPKSFIDTGYYYYDKSNITDPKIVADLYQ
jgi:ribose transport system substrate-binding protein